MENTEEILIKAKKAIAFFDLFDSPLTLFEIYKYLDKEKKIDEIAAALSSKESGLEEENGFYFLPGRREIINVRTLRHNYTKRKEQDARRFLKLFKYLPFVKVIALANSIGPYNLRDGSDIDIFVICSPRRIWLTRFVMASSAKLLNRRPTNINKRDKICLSFYITSNNLCLDDLMLPGADPYFYYWIRSLILLYNKDGIFEQFLAANHLSNPRPQALLPVRRQNKPLDYLEKLLRKIQLAIMPSALKQAMNNSAGVVVNDDVLKLYLRDKRREYAEKYGDKIREIFKESN